ncbi:CbaC protein [Natrarchaeobius chitinivorans]|uniref:CbaC protein n=1 Tax=Natrarchaeobius chitinivorans TaxID=1679083 RepID=A0A3N6LV15_NATCH|nr:CbaC protein [Natrarchaeobius chitinivorans]RQG94198.1 CbaC protein [Natrarchaeobius chitinivorans]
MRISPPRLLLIVAFVLVVFLEARTVLAFFGVAVSPLESAIAAVAVIAVLVYWGTRPVDEEPTEE